MLGMGQIVVISLFIAQYSLALRTMRHVRRHTTLKGWTAHDGLLVDESYKDKKLLTSEPWEEIFERERIDGFRADYMKVDGKITDIGHAGIYGEILPLGIRRLFDKLDIKAEDVVYDLGSGTGKVILQFAVETAAEKCHGIELGETRYKGSTRALEALKNSKDASYQHAATKCTFTKGDILADQPSWETEASILFICATAFPPELMKGMLDKIKAASSKLRAVLLYTGCGNGGNARLLDTQSTKWKFSELLCESSWDQENTVHYYEREDLDFN